MNSPRHRVRDEFSRTTIFYRLFFFISFKYQFWSVRIRRSRIVFPFFFFSLKPLLSIVGKTKIFFILLVRVKRKQNNDVIRRKRKRIKLAYAYYRTSAYSRTLNVYIWCIYSVILVFPLRWQSLYFNKRCDEAEMYCLTAYRAVASTRPIGRSKKVLNSFDFSKQIA